MKKTKPAFYHRSLSQMMASERGHLSLLYTVMCNSWNCHCHTFHLCCDFLFSLNAFHGKSSHSWLFTHLLQVPFSICQSIFTRNSSPDRLRSPSHNLKQDKVLSSHTQIAYMSSCYFWFFYWFLPRCDSCLGFVPKSTVLCTCLSGPRWEYSREIMVVRHQMRHPPFKSGTMASETSTAPRGKTVSLGPCLL